MSKESDINQHRQHENSRQRRTEREAARQTERPEPHKVGVLSVVDAVRDLEFPRSLDDILNEAGDRQVRTSEDKTFPLRDVVGKVRQKVNDRDPIEGDEVPSLSDFQTVVQRHWEAVEFMEVPPEERPKGGGFQPQQSGDQGGRP